MRNIPLTIIGLLFLTIGPLNAQPLTEAQQRARAKAQAQIMADAFLKQDLDKFISYMNPLLVKKMGGKDSLLHKFQKGWLEITKPIRSETIGEASAIFKTKADIQCIVPQTMVANYGTGEHALTTQMIAISRDGGKQWTFIDAGISVQQLNYIKSLSVNLSPELEKLLRERLMN
ncbi:MAG: hypothetical protein Q8916_08775 [Bacteroidota bacterium]|nr:hypothetical protein [Bacteroidota bacterium]MDP4230480.1 hypothetical protein [Bacteroidota bacterium]MDP4236448.1 hypothetical protein [Bacteroidota bacterium]